MKPVVTNSIKWFTNMFVFIKLLRRCLHSKLNKQKLPILSFEHFNELKKQRKNGDINKLHLINYHSS